MAKGKKSSNVEEFANRSTIHGISYVFDRQIPLGDRIFWFVVLGISCGLVGSLIVTTFNDWQEDLVITTLKNKAKPVTELEFPALTICASGAHMGLVEKVLYRNFEKWQKSSGDEFENKTISKRLQEFMKEKFQIMNSGENILDILNTMIAPSSDSSSASGVVNNQRACSADKERRKRSIQGLQYFCR